MTNWLTTTELKKMHGISIAKARYHAKQLESKGLARKTHPSRAGHWLFSPVAIEYLKLDRRSLKPYKPLPENTETLWLIEASWECHGSVNGVSVELGVSWYTAARWLDTLGLRSMTNGTMVNYANRGKKDE